MDYTTEVAIAVRKTAREALQVALSKFSLPLALTPDSNTVVIKPSIYNPDMVGNTTLEMVRAVVKLFRGTAKTYVVESDNPLRTTETAFEKSGYNVLKKDGAELLNLTSSPCISIPMAGHYFKEHPMPGILSDNPFLVNLATVKAEPETSVIGAGIKNLFGLIPETNKAQYHTELDTVLLDLLKSFRPDLTIIDFTKLVVGPREMGIDRHIGGVVVGTDPVAVDAYCADLLGMDPMRIPHLKLAYEFGLGEALLDRIRVLGTNHQKNELIRLVKNG
jgi:uncharacterized protein (DUF362 family)